MSREFEELWTLFLEGELDEAGLVSLQELLAADSKLLQQAADLYEEHRLLGFALQPFDGQQFVDEAVGNVKRDGLHFVGEVISQLRDEEAKSGRSVEEREIKGEARFFPLSQSPSLPFSKRWGGYALVAAATLLVSLTIQQFSERDDSGFIAKPVAERIQNQPVEYVATLARCEDCQWDVSDLSEGSRLMARKMTLDSGTAVIQFDGGAMALLIGPAELELESAAGANLLSGNVMIRAPEEAAGFVLRTPASDIVDLGTEFAVSVDKSGATELHVTEGEVEWHKPNQAEQQSTYLSEGNAVRFDAGTGSPRRIPLAPKRFSDNVPLQSKREGRLLVYEPFAYPFEISGTEDRAADGGTGWTTPWFCGFPASSFDLFFEPQASLSGPPRLSQSAGGSLKLPTDDLEGWHRQASKRQFKESIDLQQDGVVYFSFLVQRDSQATLEGKGSFYWILCMPQDLKARLGVGILSDGRPIVYGPSGNVAGNAPLQDDVTYLFVGKLVHGKKRPEQLFLKVFGPENRLDVAEPLDWTLVGRTVHKHQKLNQVHIYNAPGRSYTVDELRIGTSWGVVTWEKKSRQISIGDKP